MIGTPLVRETTAAPRSAPRRAPAPPPVLIEVPALPGSGPHRRTAGVRRPGTSSRPRRRLRREVRLAGLTVLVGTLAASAALAVRSFDPALAGIPERAADDPFSIELDFPIPEPAEAIDSARIEALPVAFPGYLLPGDGDGDGDEGHGHARP